MSSIMVSLEGAIVEMGDSCSCHSAISHTVAAHAHQLETCCYRRSHFLVR